MRTRKILLIISAGVASAILLYFGTGLHPVWWLLWFAPVPVIAIAPRLESRASFLIASVVWVVAALNQWDYFKRQLELPLWLIVVALLVPASIFGLGVVRTRAFLRRGWLFAAAFYFPTYWVTYEYFTALASPHSTFGNLGYTQMNCLPLIQITSITGIWGISFTLFLFAATMATLISGAGNPPQRRALAVTVGVVICAIFVFGEWRLNSDSSEQLIAVTLIAKDVPSRPGSEEQALALLHDYVDEILRLTAPGTDVVVLPEKIVRISESALPQTDAIFSTAAAAAHSAIVLGVVRRTTGSSFNSSRFYSAGGKLEANYDKQHLIPGVELEQPGDQRVLVDQPFGRWGLQICKDMDFPNLSRDYSADGANLLLVPAWDFDVDRWLHARMAILRAVENGFALARSARNGLLTLADNRGRIIAETTTIPGRFVSVAGKLNIVPARTFYSRTGDWFAWLCVAVFIGLLSSLFIRRKTEVRAVQSSTAAN